MDLFSLYIYIKKTLKIFLSETTGPISKEFCKNVSLIILYQHCSSHLDSSKNMAARGQGSFSLYIYIEKLKTLLVRNQWTDFNITWQECVFGHPLSRFKPLWFVKKCGCKGAGLIFPLYLYRKLEKITSCQKPLDRFQYNLAEMFPWWPFTKIVQAVMICQKTWLLGAGAYFPCISI